MLRVVEIYPSVQGEGPRTGVPTQFVRFAGCNLRCPGWPCDTEFAINPKQYRKEQTLYTVRPLQGKFGGDEKALTTELVVPTDELPVPPKNVCLTGGEPMLQPADELIDLAVALTDNWGFTVEMFSNGTMHYPDRLLNVVKVVMDWKLGGSGEGDKNVMTRIDNIERMGVSDEHSVKFVCKDLDDLEEALNVYDKYDLIGWPGHVYFGVVWGQPFTTADLVQAMLEKGVPAWELNVQVHNHIWPANERGR